MLHGMLQTVITTVLTNGDEIAAGTDEQNPDTDGDGDLDGTDTDPLIIVSTQRIKIQPMQMLHGMLQTVTMTVQLTALKLLPVQTSRILIQTVTAT